MVADSVELILIHSGGVRGGQSLVEFQIKNLESKPQSRVDLLLIARKTHGIGGPFTLHREVGKDWIGGILIQNRHGEFLPRWDYRVDSNSVTIPP